MVPDEDNSKSGIMCKTWCIHVTLKNGVEDKIVLANPLANSDHFCQWCTKNKHYDNKISAN